MKQEKDWFSKLLTSYGIVYGLASILSIYVLFQLLLDKLLIENRYIIWLLALNITTFVIYLVDKTSSKASGPRVPEPLLHLLGLMGGFIAGWFWILFFHKTNWREHPAFPLMMTVSTLFHAGVIYLRFFANHSS